MTLFETAKDHQMSVDICKARVEDEDRMIKAWLVEQLRGSLSKTDKYVFRITKHSNAELVEVQDNGHGGEIHKEELEIIAINLIMNGTTRIVKNSHGERIAAMEIYGVDNNE